MIQPDSLPLLMTRKRLLAWGHWCRQILSQGLDYSHQSLLAKWQHEQGVMVQSTAWPSVPINHAAEAIDELVERLAADQPQGEAKPNWAKVLRIHYTMQDKPIKARNQLAGLNQRTYYRYLYDAEVWFSQQLNQSDVA